jgi:hypothetical protein
MIEIFFHIYVICSLINFAILILILKSELRLGKKSEYFDFLEKLKLSNWNINILIIAGIFLSLCWPFNLYLIIKKCFIA